ncbi:IS3 family transposase, partial [Actinotignum urinale]|uniref:IS3 family transposase n=1 Tax=Actinotignum urinale TaxID=190146 RepID=UPI002A8121FF
MVATLRSEYPLPVLLQVAKLARSTFYYQLGQMQTQDRHVQLKQAIREIFDKSHQRYGYRRVRLQLLRDGWRVSRKLVAKLMRQLGLRSKTRKRKRYNSYRGTTSRRADNHLDRHFVTEKPNQQWVSDIT